MVTLSIATAKGAPCPSRYFPHSGYLGLTPVRVEGIVRTKLDEDRKPLPAKSISISVRCYEARVSRSRGTLHSCTLLVDHTDILWSRPLTAEWADISDLELPFKIIIPKRTAGLSTANFQVYRTFWRVEAAIDHIPITGVGHKLTRYFDLPLVRYDAPSSSPPDQTSFPSRCLQTSKPRAPVVRYTLSTPDHPVGPNDIIFASLNVQPLDPGVSVRSATLTVERRIDLLNPHASSVSPPPTPIVGPYHHLDGVPTPNSSTSTLFPSMDDSESNPSDYAASSSRLTLDSANSSRPLLSPASVSFLTPSPSQTNTCNADKTMTSIVVTTECADFTRDSSGTFSKSATLQWPATRSQSRWALGETMHTSYAVVRFYVRASVRVTGPSGTDVLELEPHEIVVTATSEAERRMALAKYTEQREDGGKSRSKSKSPWRTRHELDEERVRAEAVAKGQAKSYPGAVAEVRVEDRHRQHQSYRSGHEAVGSGSSGTAKRSRRPHTSAGPSDKSNFAAFGTAGGPASQVNSMSSGDSHVDHRLVRSYGHERKGFKGHVAAKQESGLGESVLFLGRDKDRDRVAKTRERNTGSTSKPEHVRAWEEELVRIETKSRRNSSILNMWNFGRKKELVQRG